MKVYSNCMYILRSVINSICLTYIVLISLSSAGVALSHVSVESDEDEHNTKKDINMSISMNESRDLTVIIDPSSEHEGINDSSPVTLQVYICLMFYSLICSLYSAIFGSNHSLSSTRIYCTAPVITREY